MWNINYIFHNKNLSSMALFYSFAGLFNDWLNKSQLDSSICFYIVAISHVTSSLETLVDTPESKRLKESKKNVFVSFQR